MLVEHRLAQVCRNKSDELIAAKNARQIRVIKDVVGSRETQRCTGDDHRGSQRNVFPATMHLPASLQDLGEEVAELSEVIAISFC